MIQYVSGDIYYDESSNIIFNPVGIRDNGYGFIKRAKMLYPEVYKEYHDMVWEFNIKELLGDIQLVHVENEKFIMNAFCKYADGSINKLALAKTLIELCNLAHEYKLSVSVELTLGDICKKDRSIVKSIIEEVFRNTDVDVTIFTRKKK